MPELTGLVDSHCHLDRLQLSEADGDLATLLATTHASGVSQMLCIGVDLESFPGVLALAEQYPFVHCSVGVHPLHKDGRAPTRDELVTLSAHPRVVALGETGLDYFYEKGEVSEQQSRFVTHIEAARETGLPLIIHTRDARADTINLLREVGQQQVRGVMHCFTEDWEMAKQSLDLGFMISISGIVTFRNADALRDVVRQVPLERLLIETDAPWLAPVPYRGQSNQPKYVAEVAKAVAALKSVSAQQVADQTRHNFYQLFNKARAA